MKPKLKLILAGIFLGIAVAAPPYDFATFGLVGLAALIGVDAWAQTEVRKKTYVEWREDILKKPLP